MLELNKIYNQDCIKTIEKLNNNCVDIILTSPPYNTGKNVSGKNKKSVNNFDARYDIYLENLTDEQYIKWTINLFNKFNNILKNNGVIIYNLSYSSGNKNNGYKSTDLMWKVVSNIIENTEFTVADRIIWKKKSALPNNRSSNKLTRIVEDIFIFCRKTEYITFNSNKKVVSISNGKLRSGQKSYENIYNFIEAKNNDGSCKLNKATFSSELVEKLLHIYAKENSIIYDPFIGTGTTAIGCLKCSCNYIGSELSEAQCKYAEDRINTYLKENNLKKY